MEKQSVVKEVFLTLMKGDKVVDTSEEATNLCLLLVTRIRQIDLFQVRIMKMNNRLSLSHFCHIFMRLPVGDTDSEKCGIKIR